MCEADSTEAEAGSADKAKAQQATIAKLSWARHLRTPQQQQCALQRPERPAATPPGLLVLAHVRAAVPAHPNQSLRCTLWIQESRLSNRAARHSLIVPAHRPPHQRPGLVAPLGRRSHSVTQRFLLVQILYQWDGNGYSGYAALCIVCKSAHKKWPSSFSHVPQAYF